MCRPGVFGWGSIFGRRPGGLAGCRVGGPCSTARVFLLPGRRAGFGWSARWEGLRAADRGSDVRHPGPVSGEAEPRAAAAPDQALSGGVDPQLQAFRLPAADRAGQFDQLGPGQQIGGQGDDLAPRLVPREALEWGGSAARCPLRGCGPRSEPGAVPQLEICELPFPCVGGKRSEAVPVEVGEPQLRARVRAPRATVLTPPCQPPIDVLTHSNTRQCIPTCEPFWEPTIPDFRRRQATASKCPSS